MITEDRAISGDIETVANMIANGTLLKAGKFEISAAQISCVRYSYSVQYVQIKILMTIGIQSTEGSAWCPGWTRCHANDAEDGNES